MGRFLSPPEQGPHRRSPPISDLTAGFSTGPEGGARDQEPHRRAAVIDLQLPAGAGDVAVDGGRRRAQLAGDILGAQMAGDHLQALTLAGGQPIETRTGSKSFSRSQPEANGYGKSLQS